MDRLAEPVTGPGPLSPSRARQPPPPPGNTRFEPRNLAFTHGLHRWQLDGTFLRQVTGSRDQDYSWVGKWAIPSNVEIAYTPTNSAIAG